MTRFANRRLDADFTRFGQGDFDLSFWAERAEDCDVVEHFARAGNGETLGRDKLPRLRQRFFRRKLIALAKQDV